MKTMTSYLLPCLLLCVFADGAMSKNPEESPTQPSVMERPKAPPSKSGPTNKKRAPGFQKSARGVKKGKWMLAVGGNWATSLVPRNIHLGYAYGMKENLNLTVALDTLGILNSLDLGIKWRLLHGRSVLVAVKADLNTSMVFPVGEGTSTSFGLGATPSLLVSMGGKRFVFTLQAGVDWMIAGNPAFGAVGMELGSSMRLKGKLVAEFKLSRRVIIYADFTPTIWLDPFELSPLIGAGASW